MRLLVLSIALIASTLVLQPAAAEEACVSDAGVDACVEAVAGPGSTAGAGGGACHEAEPVAARLTLGCAADARAVHGTAAGAACGSAAALCGPDGCVELPCASCMLPPPPPPLPCPPPPPGCTVCIGAIWFDGNTWQITYHWDACA